MADAATPASPVSAPRPTGIDVASWTSGRAWAWLLGSTAVSLAIDLWTKAAAFARVADAPVDVVRERVVEMQNSGRSLQSLIPPHEPVRALGDWLHLTLVLNPGAVFGIGAGKRWFFVVFTLIAVAFGVYLFKTWTRARDTMAHVALGLVLAGGLGNLYDRLVFACVRDFLHPVPLMKMPLGLKWPGGNDELWPYVSNVADLWLIVGVGLLLIFSFRGHAEPKEPAKADAAG